MMRFGRSFAASLRVASRRPLVSVSAALGSGLLLFVATGCAEAQFFGPDEPEWGTPGPWGAQQPGLAPGEIHRLVAGRGFRLLTPPFRNGNVYVADVIDRQGIQERLIVDAYSGSIMQRFRVSPRPAETAPPWPDSNLAGTPQPRVVPGIGEPSERMVRAPNGDEIETPVVPDVGESPLSEPVKPKPRHVIKPRPKLAARPLPKPESAFPATGPSPTPPPSASAPAGGEQKSATPPAPPTPSATGTTTPAAPATTPSAPVASGPTGPVTESRTPRDDAVRKKEELPKKKVAPALNDVPPAPLE